MRWMESQWFKHLCVVVIGIFFFQSVQPMVFGFAPPQPASVLAKARDVQRALPIDQFQNQVSSIIEKVKGQLQELEHLPHIQERTQQPGNDAENCGVPVSDSLASMESLTPHPSPLPSRERGNMKQMRAKNEEAAGSWLDWLSGLLVSEAHAQTPDPNLASTPDANTTDQFIVDKAQELGNDPNAIFAFVRDEIGYESYQGSLRGSRGTLWSNGGNALDQASLLIALLRASGTPARYAQGTLSDPLSQELILSMFPNQTRIVGCPPDDVERADPANDPQLLTETREHYWVQADLGGGFVHLDPTFKSAQVDQPFTTADSTFTEVPDSLRHKVTVRLNVEFNNSFTGGLQDPRTVLEQTFNTVKLVGHPLSVGNFVSTVSTPGLVFTSTTHTYSPYVQIGELDADISDDEILRGEDYQEILTNFPLSTQFLTGVFLEMNVLEPEDENGERAVELHQRDLFNRIGFAARQNGGSTNV